MNPFRRAVSRVTASLKAAAVTFAGRARSWTYSIYGRTRYGYEDNVNPRGSAIVMACVLWIARTFPEAPPRVRKRRGGELEPAPDFPLLALLNRPNPHYSGVLLWMATLADWMITGNAYWLKVRSAAGRVVQLYWIPQALVEPKWPDDGSEFISHYEYRPNSSPIRIEVADVVHFRYGLDPDNQRKGLAPLASLFRELFTDDEAANFSASLLRNLGVPGMVIAPDEDVDVSKEDAEKIKAEAEQRFGNDNRGRAMVLTAKTKITVVSFNPQQMDLKNLRRLPEERVTAIFGTPAVVVGLGAGLDRSTFANFKEAREAAYESNVIPTQRLLAAELATQLLPDFGDPDQYELDFDLSQVRVLQEDQDALFKRAGQALKDGLIKLETAQQMIGQEPDPNGDVYYLPRAVVVTPAAELGAPPEPAPAPAPVPALPAPRATVTEVPPGDGDPAQQQDQQPKALPRVEAKAGDADAVFERTLLRQRGRHVASFRGEVEAYFRGLATRVEQRYLDGAKASEAGEVKAEPLSDEELLALLPESEQDGFRGLLRAMATSVGEATFELVSDRVGMALSFDLGTPEVNAFLDRSAENVQGIFDTTRAAIRSELRAGQEAGEGVTELAKRLRGVIEETYNGRALTIAQTEVGIAQQRAAVFGYRQSGAVTSVKVLDGDQFDEACRLANGQTWTLDYADAHPVEHPNCQRAFAPIVKE